MKKLLLATLLFSCVLNSSYADVVDIGGFGDQAYKSAVADVASLPDSSNGTGDVRVVLDTFDIYIWDGAAWQLKSGSGGGAVTSVFGRTGVVSAASGDYSAFYLVKSNNLSDLASASTARTNLGLGTAATQNSTAFDASGAAATAQAFSIQRANHTGTQLAATISDFNSAAQGAVVTQTITNGVTATAPSEDAVFDALAPKLSSVTYKNQIFVDKAGNDATCLVDDASKPCLKIEKALTLVNPAAGYTVINIGPGNYTENSINIRQNTCLVGVQNSGGDTNFNTQQPTQFVNIHSNAGDITFDPTDSGVGSYCLSNISTDNGFNFDFQGSAVSGFVSLHNVTSIASGLVFKSANGLNNGISLNNVTLMGAMQLSGGDNTAKRVVAGAVTVDDGGSQEFNSFYFDVWTYASIAINQSTAPVTIEMPSSILSQGATLSKTGSPTIITNLPIFSPTTPGDWSVAPNTVNEALDTLASMVGAIPSAPVSSVFGRIGAVGSANGDYTASQVTNVPAGNISATDVQAAINELDTEKEPVITTLPISKGGTNKTSYTATNVIFAGAGGTSLTEDATSAFQYDSTNKRLSLNGAGTGKVNATVTSGSDLAITGFCTGTTNNCVSIQNQAAYTMQLTNAASSALAGASLGGAFSRGTLAARTQSLAGDQLFSLTSQGYTGSAFGPGLSGAISFVATENTSATANGNLIALSTTPNGSLNPVSRMTIGQNGVVNISNLTASLPVQTDASKNLVSAAINLSGTQVTATLGVANGGSGAASFTANSVLLGNGTSAFQVVAPGTSGNILTSNGTTWSSTAPSSTFSGNLTVGGHIIYNGTSTTATVNANAGTSATCSITSGKDGAGSVSLTTGSGSWATGVQCRINFSATMAAAPKCVLMATNSQASASFQNVYLTKTTADFSINFTNPDNAAGTYTWDYLCAE